MLTALRVARVAAFMFYCVAAYAFAALRGPVAREAKLDGLYLEWAQRVLRAFGVSLRVEGAEHLPPRGARRVLLSNHQSQLDIPSLIASMGEGAGFVAKKELARVPLLAWWMRRVGCVFIDRSDKFAARKAMAEAAAGLGAHPLVVFPEGTRSKTGALLPVKLGGIRMALQARALVVPVHIRGTRTGLEARVEARADASAKVEARVRFFPPVDTRELPDDKESLAKVKGYLEACWAEGEQAAS